MSDAVLSYIEDDSDDESDGEGAKGGETGDDFRSIKLRKTKPASKKRHAIRKVEPDSDSSEMDSEVSDSDDEEDEEVGTSLTCIYFYCPDH